MINSGNKNCKLWSHLEKVKNFELYDSKNNLLHSNLVLNVVVIQVIFPYDRLADNDIVLTTYNIVAKEVGATKTNADEPVKDDSQDTQVWPFGFQM